MATFKDEKVDALIKAMLENGYISTSEVRELEFLERIEHQTVTAEQVIAQMNVGKLRQDEYDHLTELASDAGTTLPTYEPALSTQMFTGEAMAKFFGASFEAGAKIQEGMPQKPPSEEGIREMRQDFVRLAAESGVNIQLFNLAGANTLHEIVNYLLTILS